jgi:hypothetical protein
MSGSRRFTRMQRNVYGQKWAVFAAMARHGKWLRKRARELALGDRALSRRMVRQARARLEELDARRFGEGDDEHLRRALGAAMRDLALRPPATNHNGGHN